MYTLTEEEYSTLKEAAQRSSNLPTPKQLQTICTLIADTMPIKWSWGIGKESPMPWKCIINQSDWYCDECPVRRLCEYPHKKYSQ